MLTINSEISSLAYYIPFNKYLMPFLAYYWANRPLQSKKLLNKSRCLSLDDPFYALSL